MMKLKVIVLILLATVQLFAISQKSVEYYVKKYVEQQTHSPVEKIETISTYEVGGTDGWHVYFLSLSINMKMGNVTRLRHLSKIVFVKGKQIAFSLKDKKGEEYAKLLKPTVPPRAYNREHLLAGNVNARHKILLISDPFCPFCQEIVPPLITAVQQHPNLFALYSYQLPLIRIHPASEVVTKVMVLLHHEGRVEDYKKMYHLLVSEKEKNEHVLLKAIEKKIGRKFTHRDLMKPEIKKTLAFDKAMKKRLLVTGTPTIFIDGVWDSTRMAYKKYIKKAKTEKVIVKKEKIEKKQEKEESSSFFDFFN